MLNCKQTSFVVVKFLKTNEDSDDEVEYEVGRTKWLVGFNNNNDYIDKKLTILWPPKSSMVCNAVKMDKNPDSSWRIEQVQVKKLYSNILSACNAAKGYEASSTYQSENELGRGCRKKKRKQNFSFNNESQKNKYRRIRRTINSSTEDENDCPSFRIKEKIVKSPPPVQFSKSEVSSKSTNCRYDEDEKLMETVKLKMALSLKQKEYSNKKFPEKLSLEKSKQDSFVTEIQLFDENLKKIFLPTNFDKNHESQLCESFESVTNEMQDNNTGCVIITPQKNYRKSFSSHISFSNNSQLKSPEKSCSQVSLSNNQLESSTKSFNSQMSLVSSQHKSPVKPYSSQLSLINNQPKNPTALKSPVAFSLQKIRKEKSYSSQKSCNSQLSLSNSQLKSPTKFIKSSLSQSNNYFKSPKESHRRELFLSPTKCASDNSLLHLLLKEVQEIKKKAAVERQEINLKLDRIMSFHCRLSRFLLPNNEKHIRPDNMPSYPLKNDEQMEFSEEYLKNNENFRNLVHYFAQMKVKAKEEFKVKDSEVLYAVMAAAITNSLACKYNFRGDGNQKRPFCKLLLWEVIIGAIHDKRPNVSVADLSLYAGQWLKNAPYRKQEDGSYGRRDKKFKVSTDEPLSSSA